MYECDSGYFYCFLSGVIFDDFFRFLRGRYEGFLQDMGAAVGVGAQDIVVAFCCFV